MSDKNTQTSKLKVGHPGGEVIRRRINCVNDLAKFFMFAYDGSREMYKGVI